MSLAINNWIDFDAESVHIWSIRAIEDKARLDGFIKLLSEDEILRANRYHFEKDRSVYITAKFLLRTLLGNYLGEKPEEITFGYSEFGKPSYFNDDKLDFNVSHSANRIILGFSKGMDIGVDIEKVKNDFDTLELAENFFSKEEIRILLAFDEADRHMAFFRCWTRKESFIKAVGQGFSYPLDSFAVSMDDDFRAEFLKIDKIPAQENNWKLHSFVPAEGYIAAISTNGQPDTIQFYDGSGIV